MDPREDVCRRARPLGAAVLAAVLAVSAPAAAQVKPERAAPDLDARGAIGRALAQRPGAALAEQDAALEALRAAAPALRVRWSALTGNGADEDRGPQRQEVGLLRRDGLRLQPRHRRGLLG